MEDIFIPPHNRNQIINIIGKRCHFLNVNNWNSIYHLFDVFDACLFYYKNTQGLKLWLLIRKSFEVKKTWLNISLVIGAPLLSSYAISENTKRIITLTTTTK